MAKVQNGEKGPFTLVRVNGKRSKLQLTKFSEEAAQTICHHITQLESSAAAGSPVPAETQDWLAKVDQDLHQRMAKVGLCPGYRDITVKEAIAEYLEAEKKDAAPSTIVNKRGHLVSLAKFLEKQPDIPLGDFTESYARDFQDYLEQGPLTPQTRSRRMGVAKALFQRALDAGHIRHNPFDWFIGKTFHVDPKEYISPDRVEHLIEYAPSPSWKMLIALSRYGGLRIPSEMRKLKWTDIDWQEKRFCVHSKKTKRYSKQEKRYVPLFRELALHMEPYRESSGLVIPDQYRSYDSPLKNWCKKLDIEVWRSPFHSMRASRITDLLKLGKPVQSVAKWMGNSPGIIWEHYALVQQDDAADLV